MRKRRKSISVCLYFIPFGTAFYSCFVRVYNGPAHTNVVRLWCEHGTTVIDVVLKRLFVNVKLIFFLTLCIRWRGVPHCQSVNFNA